MRLLTLLVCLLAGPALANGIAMHGAPKYGPGDACFSYANPDVPRGGAIQLAHGASFDTLNPFAIGGVAAPGLHHAYARLSARAWDEPFSLYPLIAARLEVPEDRSALTITLRPEATFSDGAPVTVEDVLFSFRVLRDHGRPNMRNVYGMAEARRLDDRTVRFALHAGHDREAAMILALMPVLQKAWWEGRDFSAPLAEAPPTPGPYRIAQVDPGRSVTYERIPDWWGEGTLAGCGHNNFDAITYTVVRDATSALAMLAKGEIAWWEERDIGRWRSGDYGDAAKEVLPRGAGKVHAIVLNTRRAPLYDIRVRKALGLLFDAGWVGRTLYHGLYTRTRGIFPNTGLSAPGVPGASDGGRQAAREAGRLLDAAGFPVAKNGRRGLGFELLISGPRDEAIATAFARDMARAGITVTPRRVDGATFSRRLRDYDYGAVVHAWHTTLSPGTEQAAFWSCAAADSPGSFNYAGICTEEIDALLARIPQVTTRAALAEATGALDAAVMGQHALIPLFHPGAARIARQPWIQRPEATPLHGPVTEAWWMDPGRAAR